MKLIPSDLVLRLKSIFSIDEEQFSLIFINSSKQAYTNSI